MAVEPHRKPLGANAPVVLVAIAVSLTGLLAGCGSSHSTGTAADPAEVVPSSAQFYAGATVRPGEPLKAAARADGQALTHRSDPYLGLLGALQTPGSPPLDFGRDVSSWLGARAGIFLTSPGASAESTITALLAQLGLGRVGASSAVAFPFSSNGSQGAIVLDTTNVAGASSFLDGQARRAGAHAASYRGVSYQLSAGGVAFGVVDRFAVIGSESGLRSVIDTTLGGASLARAAGYSKLTADAPAQALAHLYANVGPSQGSNLASAPPSPPRASAQGSKAGGLLGLLRLAAGTRTVNVSLVPSATSIALDADTAPAGQAGPAGASSASDELLSSVSQGAAALDELPGESWLAIGLGNLRTAFAADVQGLRGLASLPAYLAGRTPATRSTAGISVGGLLEGILAPLGVLGEAGAQAQHEFRSWMDSAGLFASGTGLLELKGGVAISSNDPALSRAAVGELAAKLRKAGDSIAPVSIPGTEASVAARVVGLPVELDIAAGRDNSGQAKFVIGIGEASVAAALRPASTLSTAAARAAAAATLGEGIQPSLIVNFPTLLGLLEGVGLLEDPTISPLVPYLRSLTTLAGGEKGLGGGIERFKLIAGLQGG
jgi:hypothetical protein